MKRPLIIATITSILALSILATSALGATDYKNCTALNKKYSGGVAKSMAAKNKAVAGGVKYAPVVNKALYDANSSKDRDKDGVACEK